MTDKNVKKEQSFIHLMWLGLSGTVVCLLLFLIFCFRTSWPIDLIGSTVFAAFTIFFFGVFFWPNFRRNCADRGWLWLRVPEMFAAFIEKDRGLFRIYINVSGGHREHFEKLAKKRNDQHGYERIVLLGPKKEIVWIGLPWIYRLKTPWFEHSADKDGHVKEPKRFVDLKERTIDYTPEKEGAGPDKERGVVPIVGTRDPIQVRAYLVVTLRVWDPEAALYNVQFYMEAVRKEIVSRWRRAVAECSYFRPQSALKNQDDQTAVNAADNGVEQENQPAQAAVNAADQVNALEINPSIQMEVYSSINKIMLGLGLTGFKTWKPADGSAKKLFLMEYEPEYEEGGKYQDDFFPHSPAHKCLHRWGVLIHNIEVRDLEPADPALIAAMEKKSKSQAIAAAAVLEATGKMASRKKQAEGELVYERSVRQGIADGLEAIGKIADNQGGRSALALEATTRVAQGAKTIVVDGGVSGVVTTAKEVLNALADNQPIPKPGPGTGSNPAPGSAE